MIGFKKNRAKLAIAQNGKTGDEKSGGQPVFWALLPDSQIVAGRPYIGTVWAMLPLTLRTPTRINAANAVNTKTKLIHPGT